MKKIILPIIVTILIILAGYEGYVIYKQNNDIAKLQQENDSKQKINGDKKELISLPIIEMDKEKPLPTDLIKSFPGDNFKKKLNNGLEVEIVITDKEKNEAELRFSNYEITGDAYSFRGSEYQTYIFEDVNSSWFNFSFVGLGTNELYFKDSSGHEGIPQHYIAKGTHLINLGELLKGLLADKFLNEIFPQINLTFYPSFIRVEEENYCCDTLYDSNNSEREQYRKVFFVDRKTYNIFKEDKVPRR